jgi:hypothetical protein
MPQRGRRLRADELVRESAVQLAERVCDLPAPYVPSEVRYCSACGAKVWLSRGAFPLADRLTIVCRPCWEARPKTIVGPWKES